MQDEYILETNSLFYLTHTYGITIIEENDKMRRRT